MSHAERKLQETLRRLWHHKIGVASLIAVTSLMATIFGGSYDGAVRSLALAYSSEKDKAVGPPKKGPSEEPSKDLPRRLYTGKVVLLQEALKRQGIESRDEYKNQAVLETAAGELIPIIPDWRGRAFFQDKRLRDRKVELVAIRREKVPFLQVLMVFAFDEQGKRQYVDYWCDRCSIPMYEIKPCECCQDEIRLRFQPQSLPAYLEQPPASRVSPGSNGKSSGDRLGKKIP